MKNPNEKEKRDRIRRLMKYCHEQGWRFPWQKWAKKFGISESMVHQHKYAAEAYDAVGTKPEKNKLRVHRYGARFALVVTKPHLPTGIKAGDEFTAEPVEGGVLLRKVLSKV